MEQEFYYPENLGKDATILCWKATNAVIVFAGIVGSILLFCWTSLYIPIIAVAVFAFATIRLSDSDYSVYDYCKILIRYLFGQKIYHWRID